MGRALVEAAQQCGHSVVLVTGPVDIEYPAGTEIIPVISTEEMLEASREAFARCDGLIGVAAPCDYRPVRIESNKIAKTGEPLSLNLIETDDIVATLAQQKGPKWVVGFALETEDHRLRALAKLERKSCDLMVLNGPEAMHSLDNQIEILSPEGGVIGKYEGTKEHVAAGIFEVIEQQLIKPHASSSSAASSASAP